MHVIPFAKNPEIEAAARPAGHQDGPDHRQADLPSVIVAREHQVDAPPRRPGRTGGQVAHHQVEVGLGCRPREQVTPPGIARPTQGDPAAGGLDGRPSPFQGPIAGVPHRAIDAPVILSEVVIPQDRELPQAAPQAAQDRLDPGDGRVVVEDVAGEQHEVGLVAPVQQDIGDPLEVVAGIAAGEVEVAQVQDRQAVEPRRQAVQLDRPLGEARPQRLIDRPAKHPRPPTLALRSLQVAEVELRLPEPLDAGRRSPQKGRRSSRPGSRSARRTGRGRHKTARSGATPTSPGPRRSRPGPARPGRRRPEAHPDAVQSLRVDPQPVRPVQGADRQQAVTGGEGQGKQERGHSGRLGGGSAGL